MWSLVWAVKFPHIALCWAWIQLQLVKAQIQNSAQFQRLHCLNWKYLFLLELFPVSPHYLYGTLQTNCTLEGEMRKGV